MSANLELRATRPPKVGPAVPNRPRRARVRQGGGGVPELVDGERIEQVRESWLIEDRWWTGREIRRRYWELVSMRGRNIVVFHDLRTGEWFTQRG